MPIDARLENYLSTLERALAPIPVSDRADIITEIKSHVLSALERDLSLSLDSVLAALGEAETVANRYLLERGLKPGKPPISPIVKWIVIGFLGTLALLVAGVVALVLYLSPIVEVSSDEEKVTLLGGLIRVEGENLYIDGKMRVHSASHSSVRDFKKGERIGIRMTNGSLEFYNSSDAKFHWSCKRFQGEVPSALVETELGPTLELKGSVYLKCEVGVPQGAELTIEGSNGKLELMRPLYSVKADLANGKVEMKRDRSARYAFETSVVNGMADEPSSDPGAEYKMNLSLANGQIEID